MDLALQLRPLPIISGSLTLYILMPTPDQGWPRAIRHCLSIAGIMDLAHSG